MPKASIALASGPQKLKRVAFSTQTKQVRRKDSEKEEALTAPSIKPKEKKRKNYLENPIIVLKKTREKKK